MAEERFFVVIIKDPTAAVKSDREAMVDALDEEDARTIAKAMAPDAVGVIAFCMSAGESLTARVIEHHGQLSAEFQKFVVRYGGSASSKTLH